MNKKFVIVCVIIIVVCTLIRFILPEDTWLCQNGQWVKHGNPSLPMPVSECK